MRAVKCPVFIDGKQLDGPLLLDIDAIKEGQKYKLPVQTEPPSGYEQYEGRVVLVKQIEHGPGSAEQVVYYFTTLD